MVEIESNVAPGKRSLQEHEPHLDEEHLAAKRSRTDSFSGSAHLIFLEELCGLEEDDAESVLGPSSSVSSSLQEDLVAEMMKSLEKVIEDGEGRGTLEASASLLVPETASLADTSEHAILGASERDAGMVEIEHGARASHEDPQHEEDFEDLQMRQIMQASDDELGVSLSSSSSDFEDISAFGDEWTFLSEQEGIPSFGFNWADASLQQVEEARELYEPVVLF